MKFWNETLKNMTEYIPGEQPANIDEYVKLNTNENPFPPSDAVLDSIKKAANGSLRLYPDPEAMSVRKIFAEQHGLVPENIFISNGSDEIFTLIFRAFVNRTGKAAFGFPSYSLYDTVAEACGISYDKIPLREDFTYDLGLFLKKNYELAIITSPNNPTGTHTPVEEIEDFLTGFKGLLVVDEAYIDFYGGSCIELVSSFDNLIVTRSLSKSSSLAGLRVGIAAAHRDLIKGFMKIKDSYNIDRLAIAGAEAALKDEKGFNYNIKMIRNNKEYLEERLESMNFQIVPSKANFILVKHPDIESSVLYEELKSRKILVRYFKGDLVNKYLRITVGTMMEIKKLCNALDSILEA